LRVKVKDLAERLASCDPQALVVLVDVDGFPVPLKEVVEGSYSANYDEFALEEAHVTRMTYWNGVKAVGLE
jgi:hypothetical protein